MNVKNLILVLVSAVVSVGVGASGCGGNEATGAGGAGTSSSSGKGGGGGIGGMGGATASSGMPTSSASSGMGPVGPTTGTMTMSSKLGEACDDDAQCNGGKCLKSTDNVSILGGGGPANGYCTFDCEDDSGCPGATSVCLKEAGEDTGICFLGCELGPEGMYVNDPLDEEKCHGREDLGCISLGGNTVCYPSCGSDAACGGRKCSPKLAVCVDDEPKGLPMGAECNQMAMPDECAGICAGFIADDPKNPITVCSQRCVFGGELLQTNDCGGLTQGICVFLPQDTGPGDLGFCTGACTKHDQCINPGFFCVETNFHEPNGFCLPVSKCKTQNDCEDPAVCTPTKYGQFCLSEKWELGSAAPGTGGGGVGGAGGSPGVGGAGGSPGVGGAGGS